MPNHGFRRGSLKNVKFEKRPGDDWIVEVLVVDENEVYAVSVFGAKDQAEAESDALSGFLFQTPDNLRVVKVERVT